MIQIIPGVSDVYFLVSAAVILSAHRRAQMLPFEGEDGGDEFACEQVRPAAPAASSAGIGCAEDDDEGEDGGAGDEREHLFCERGALHADHGADEGVDEDEEGELRDVLAQAKPWGAVCGLGLCLGGHADTP